MRGLIDDMGVLRKLASISTVGVVSFRDPAEQQIRHARKYTKADARVARLEQASAQLQARRSAAEAEIARQEAEKLRANLDALQARYSALQRSAKT